MKSINKSKLLQYCGWLGIIGVIFYFLHVLVGNLLYEGYNPVTQAISDLTAKGAPSKMVAGILTAFYGAFLFLFNLAFYLFFRKKINRIFSLGALSFIIMNLVSTVGYTLFPLSEAGYANTFQDIMHVAVTVLVVVLSITSLVLLAIGFFKSGKYKLMGILAIATLFFMMLGSILTGAATSILGIAERISIYSLHLYILALAIWLLKYKENKCS